MPPRAIHQGQYYNTYWAEETARIMLIDETNMSDFGLHTYQARTGAYMPRNCSPGSRMHERTLPTR